MVRRKKVEAKQSPKPPKFSQSVLEESKADSENLNEIAILGHVFADPRAPTEVRLAAADQLQGMVLLYDCEGGPEMVALELIKKCICDPDNDIKYFAGAVLSQVFITQENWEEYEKLVHTEDEFVVEGAIGSMSSLFALRDIPKEVCLCIAHFLKSENLDIASAAGLILFNNGYGKDEILSKLSENQEAYERMQQVLAIK